LKRAYSTEIEGLVRSRVNHITKEEFLPAFKAAYDKAIVESNIIRSFRGAGLVPHDESAVLSKLDIRLRTPTPSSPELPQWESQTPRTSAQVAAQSLHVKERIQRHQDSSPTSIFEGLDRLQKGITLMAHGASVMQVELERLRAANALLSKRKSRKRKVLKGVTSISVADALKLKDQQAIAGNEASIEALSRR
jgi:hypothetical protein